MCLGGGTPTTVTDDQLERVLKGCVKEFKVAPDAEISIESSPATMDIEQMKSIRKAGYNRISIGVQSFEKTE